MCNLIKAELFKLAKSYVYRILLAVVVCFEIFWIYSTYIVAGVHATGAEWLTIMVPYMLFNLVFLCLFATSFVIGEFRSRTFSYGLMCGHTRIEIFSAKTVVFYIAMIPFIMIHALIGAIMLSVWNGQGFGRSFNTDTIIYVSTMLAFSIIGHCVAASQILLLAVLTRSRIITIGVGVIGFYIPYIICANLKFIKDPVVYERWHFVMQFTRTYQIVALVDYPDEHVSLFIFMIISLVTFAMYISIAGFIFAKRDLK